MGKDRFKIMSILDVLSEDLVITNLDVENKDEAITFLCKELELNNRIRSAEGFSKDVYERESIGETGMGGGIAIPHGLSSEVTQASVAIAKLDHTIEWESLDDKPVDLIFMIAVPKDGDNQAHIRILSSLASVLAYEENVNTLRHSESANKLFTRLVTMLKERE